MVKYSRLSAFALTSCLAAMAFAPARAERPYTVDDMLSVESIGAARFDPSGQRLIFERYGPFDRQSNYGRQEVIGEHRSKIYAVDLSGNAMPSLLFAQEPGDGYTIGGLSPDGGILVFRHASNSGIGMGAVALSGGTARMFDFSPAYSPTQVFPWSGHRVAVTAAPPGEIDSFAAIGNEQVEAVAALWRQRNRGDAATASRIGSGRFAAFPAEEGRLVLADADNARVTVLAAGRFSGWYASVDGAALAALREERLTIDPDQRIEHGANIGGIQRRLLILNQRADADAGALHDACPGCDVLARSLNWSAAAPLLAFVARDAGAEWSAARYRVYDHSTGRTHAVDLGVLKPHAGRAGFGLDIRSTWIGDRLAVFAEQPGAVTVPNANGDVRADWYLVRNGAPLNLTGGFAGASPNLVAVGRQGLVVLHEGEAWLIDARGNRHNLTADIAEPVRAWREPSPYGPTPVENLQPGDSVTLQVASGTDGVPDRLLFVDLASGRIDTVTAPSSTSEFIAASPAARRAALTARGDNVTTLMVVGTDGSRRELARLNEHLRDVAGGTPVRIDHKGPDGSDRMSWLLLPPGHRPGQRLPTVVNVYPGSVGRETWHRWELDDVHALNDHILAAHGYAILYPSIPVRYDQVPRDPLQGLPEQVFAAVDAAITRGYVDPERMAVQGQSYGGYTTGALVGLTSRFRSAVAQAGIYDLVSSYGQFDIRTRLEMERTGLNLFSASLMESGQGGMGAPPWEDPERYLRNSPLMHVRNINTPIMLISGDLDYVSTTQTEEFFTALTRLNKDAVFVRYYGEDHVFNSPANIRDMWRRILDWYDTTLGPAGRDLSR
jgi:dipeptidyl aminopeptidase/acylaminoacyl peptidase